jgi:hypothetical protein
MLWVDFWKSVHQVVACIRWWGTVFRTLWEPPHDSLGDITSRSDWARLSLDVRSMDSGTIPGYLFLGNVGNGCVCCVTKSLIGQV